MSFSVLRVAALVACLSGLAMAMPVLAAPAASIDAAANSPGWSALLYYRQVLGGVESDHDDPAFFLSANGRVSPVEELQAHLDAWVHSREPGDAHPACRFPARYHWLASQGLLSASPAVTPHCEAFEHFRNILGATGVTMVHPVPHMGNVTTMFAHSFLRLDREQGEGVDHSQDFTLNFAALVQPDADQAEVVRKGLSNGFPGVFTVIRYQKKLGEYTHMDARDIWEYRLDFTPEETAQIVSHAWEMKPVHANYRFFSSNCSNQMLHFIDVARPGLALHQTQHVYVIPIDAINAVVQSGAVKSTRFVASDRTRRREERTGEAPPVSPVKGHDSGRISVAAGMREGVGTLDVGIRAASHDLLDPPNPGPLGAEVSVLDAQVRRYSDGPTELQKISFFEARSMDPRDAESASLSWQFGTGFTGRRLPGDAPVVAHDASRADRYRAELDASQWINPFYLRVAVGPTWGSTDAVFFTLIGAEWQAHSALESGQQAWATAQQGVLWRGERWQTSLEWSLAQPTWERLPAEGALKARLTRAIDHEWSVFGTVSRDKDVLGYQSGVAVGAGRFF